MFSMPPATTTSASPSRISWAAIMMAFMPLAHTLFTVVAGMFSGSPAAMEAWRAGAWPRLACSTQPMITSFTSCASTPDRSTAALMAVAPSSVAGTVESAPPKEPMGVRTADTITTSRAMGIDVFELGREGTEARGSGWTDKRVQPRPCTCIWPGDCAGARSANPLAALPDRWFQVRLHPGLEIARGALSLNGEASVQTVSLRSRFDGSGWRLHVGIARGALSLLRVASVQKVRFAAPVCWFQEE